MFSPSVDMLSPSVHMLSPSVDMLSLSVDMLSPSVDILSPSVDMLSPSVDMLSPSVDMLSPSVDMLHFGVTIPATVPQRSDIPEGLLNYPILRVYFCILTAVVRHANSVFFASFCIICGLHHILPHDLLNGTTFGEKLY
jgi:hypothetical protein